jgi:hypothetical protein
MKSIRFLSAVLSTGLVLGAGFTSIAGDSKVAVKVHSVTGTSPQVAGKALAVGAALKAQDIIQTGGGTTVELLVQMDANDLPGTLVRVTPNTKMTVLSLTQATRDDETVMEFEVAAVKVAEPTATLAATVSE